MFMEKFEHEVTMPLQKKLVIELSMGKCEHISKESYHIIDGGNGPLGGPYGRFGTKCSHCGVILSTGWWDGTKPLKKKPPLEVSVSNRYDIKSDIFYGVRLKVPDEIIPLLNEEEMKKFISFKESSKLRNDGYLEMSANMIVDFSIFILDMKKKYTI